MSIVFEILSLYLTIEINPPSQSSGRIWVRKIGYYCLHKPKPKADDWVLIFDESIGIGQEKLLVILGIRASEIDFTRPLKIQDMEPIIVKSSKNWTGEAISKELESCKEMLGKILYATTDGSSTLRKALRISGINYVYDVTHAVAIMLEKLYLDKPDFKDFTQLLVYTRSKLFNTEHAHLIPPAQRTKSRFLNIEILVDWCIKVLTALKKNDLTLREKELLQWVEKKRFFIEDMILISKIIEDLSILLKNNGLSSKTKTMCFQILKKCQKTSRQSQFNTLFREYLKTNTAQIKRWSRVTLLCSSDVIESTFGKFKNELSKNPMSGITDLALIIPAFTSKLEVGEIKKAIESCTCKDIKLWSSQNLCDSLSKKRKMVFNSCTVGG